MAKSKAQKPHPAQTQASESPLGKSIFKRSSEVNLGTMVELTSPPIVRMRDMAIGDIIDGTILSVIPSRQKTIKSPLLVLALTDGGDKVSVPAQAVICSTLLPDYDNDKQEDRENPEGKCPYVGRRVFIKLVGHKLSPKFKDDNDQPRKYPVYDIAVSKK